MNAASAHLTVEGLLDYWLHEGDAAATDAMDEHLMQCEACGRVLDELIALGEGVRELFRAGAVEGMTSAAFVDRLAAQGLRVREYRLLHNGSVNCTVAPDDELLVARLAVPLQGVERLDVQFQPADDPGVQHTWHDVPFDAQAGEVIYLPRLAEVRGQTANSIVVTLLAVAPGGARELGRYTFHHRPWPGH